ncbi:MACPF domain-containing protein At4g24290 [Morus notabilis]|uniref:MACPF domain-containing protein At4g24290 n=1 Tax=Morus notabilis TaxID=981085 RepID=UPI000CED0019|nr:MACPF domain-containing protein At4g24290 [Morus notabilis]
MFHSQGSSKQICSLLAVTCGKVSESKRKKDVPENRSLYPFPELIGRGYDISTDLQLKYYKGGDSFDSRLIEIDEDDGREIVLPGGIIISNVSKSIKCDKGERTPFRSDVLSFQQMSEQFNQEIYLTGKIPSGLFNAMFDFSGCWQKDAANNKTLAFDGVFITLYTVALKSLRWYYVRKRQRKEDSYFQTNNCRNQSFIDDFQLKRNMGKFYGPEI